MRNTLFKYSLLLLVFIASSLNLVHAGSLENNFREEVKFSHHVFHNDQSRAFAFTISAAERIDFLCEDSEEEEEFEEELVHLPPASGTSNYFTDAFGLSKIHYYNLFPPKVPVFRIEPLKRLCQKRYRYLEVFRI